MFPKTKDVPCPCDSGKTFTNCHGLVNWELKVEPSSDLKLAPPPLLKLDLGCGNTPREGFEGVDIAGDKAKHKVNLFKFPWTFADNSVEEINLSHFMEHIPAREIEQIDISPATATNHDQFVGQDMMFAFFDEMWRILKHDGWVHVVVPCARNNRAFQDPTHRRFIVEDTFAYFSKEWRDLNVPQYKVRCNFGTNVSHTIINDIALRTPEVQGNMIRNQWNVAVDLIAKMKCIKQ